MMFYVLKNGSKIVPNCIKRFNLTINSIYFKFHTKSVKEFYKQTFERLDLNRDGRINEDDLKWTLSTLGYGEGIISLLGYANKDHLAYNMMMRLDGDKKGAVDLESLVKFIEQKCPSEDHIIQNFKDLDKNEDGFLCKDELRQYLIKQHNDIPDLVLDDLVDKQMRLYDKDKDGFVTMNEYISAWYYLDVVGAIVLKNPDTI